MNAMLRPLNRPMRLGELIRTHRQRQGMSQEALGDAIGMNAARICNIETGATRNPLFKTVVNICDVLGISLEEAAKCERP
jgi:transcriptional regulator with XRE-family HTH domain